MFFASLLLSYACMIHAQVPSPSTHESTTQSIYLRNQLNIDWSQHRIHDKARSIISNLDTSARPRVDSQTNSEAQRYQNYQTMMQKSRWNKDKDTLPYGANFVPKSYSVPTWNDARNVVHTNFNPPHTKQPNLLQIKDNLPERPLEESLSGWKKVKNSVVLDLRPDSHDQTEIDDDNLANLMLPNNNPALAKSKQPSLTSWQDVQGHFTAGLALPSNPKLWKPPSYFQSLRDLEDAMTNIKVHFAIDRNTPKNDPRYKYIAVVHVIEGLTQEVSRHGWDAYNNNYEALVLRLLDNISQHPEETMAEVNCVFEASIKKIQRIKKLMANQWVDYLCKAQSCVCDTLVYAIVKMSGDEELNQEAELLLLLGLAALDYLDIYSRVFDAVSKQNVYIYLKNSKETLRTLIYKNSIARRHSSFSIKDQCYAAHSMRSTADFS